MAAVKPVLWLWFVPFADLRPRDRAVYWDSSKHLQTHATISVLQLHLGGFDLPCLFGSVVPLTPLVVSQSNNSAFNYFTFSKQKNESRPMKTLVSVSASASALSHSLSP